MTDPKTKPHIFKPGDRASFGGVKGTVLSAYYEDRVLFRPDGRSSHTVFTADGRLWEEQTKPLLKPLRKKKKPGVWVTRLKVLAAWNELFKEPPHVCDFDFFCKELGL